MYLIKLKVIFLYCQQSQPQFATQIVSIKFICPNFKMYFVKLKVIFLDCPRSQEQFAIRALSIFVTALHISSTLHLRDLYQPDTLLSSRAF